MQAEHAIPLFGLILPTALTGLMLALTRFKGIMFPMRLSLFHGCFAATLFLYVNYLYWIVGLPSAANISYALLVFAVALGFFNFGYFHLQNKMLPKPLMLIHGLSAFSAFVIMFGIYFGLIN